MPQAAPLVAALLLFAPAGAQENAQSSAQAMAVEQASADGSGSQQKNYRRVEKDGRVVEASGDRGLLRLLEQELGADLPRRPGDGAADARADARAEADGSSRSHTRRVVVINGETLVDEETVDGKPVRRGGGRPGGLPGGGGGGGLPRGFDPAGGFDVEAELERMLREMGLDPALVRRAGESNSSSHTRRVVVRNGETIVDEETVDGRPVPPGRGGGLRPRGAELRGLDPDLEKLLESLEIHRGGADPGPVRSRTRRIVVRDGRTVLDEASVGDRPRRLGPTDPGELFRDLDPNVLRGLRELRPERPERAWRRVERARAPAPPWSPPPSP